MNCMSLQMSFFDEAYPDDDPHIKSRVDKVLTSIYCEREKLQNMEIYNPREILDDPKGGTYVL